MKEVGIDIADQEPKVLTTEAVQASDYVITMGCGDACPIFPGKKYLDWELQDPAGQGIGAVRPIRDQIKSRIDSLIAEIDAKQERGPPRAGPRRPPPRRALARSSLRGSRDPPTAAAVRRCGCRRGSGRRK